MVNNVHTHHAGLCLTLLNILPLCSSPLTSGKHLSLPGCAAEVQVLFRPVLPTTIPEMPRGAPPPRMASETPPAPHVQGFQGRCKCSNSCLHKPCLTSSAVACKTKTLLEIVPVQNPLSVANLAIHSVKSLDQDCRAFHTQFAS